MAVHTFDELYKHYGHDIEIGQYINMDKAVANVALECVECHEVLLDFDKE